jgi:hypothetical protein
VITKQQFFIAVKNEDKTAMHFFISFFRLPGKITKQKITSSTPSVDTQSCL